MNITTASLTTHFHLVAVQMVQTFSHCVLGSGDEMDLDELLATKLVTFMMEHHNTVFQVPSKLRRQVDEHLSHLKRVQVSPPHSLCAFAAHERPR